MQKRKIKHHIYADTIDIDTAVRKDISTHFKDMDEEKFVDMMWEAFPTIGVYYQTKEDYNGK